MEVQRENEQAALAWVRQAAESERERLQTLRTYVDECDRLIELVRDLPKRTSWKAAIPFGSKAFFLGRIKHTNELMVHLGDDYFVDRSAFETVQIIQKRKDFAQNSAEEIENVIREMEAREKVIAREDAGEDAPFEIREDYDEAVHAIPQTQKKSVTFAKDVQQDIEDADVEHDQLMKRLEELELLEAQQEAQQSPGSPLRTDLEAPKSHKEPMQEVPGEASLASGSSQKKKPVPMHERVIERHTSDFSKSLPQEQGSASSTKRVSKFKQSRKEQEK
uniref:Uncharacterized protein n=1 Tax=Picocystis salinarum TaxID=88271 RepID=A0A7S3XFI6_9CHLO|mmetsp:Transcript_1611/g.9927  ORF Transcript_1611/g.9927 Transcript_1611/m.9927 type:complete len:277 (+) Transcript_1611:207-1037(+)